MQIWKRIIVYVVVLVMTIGCIVFPASAAAPETMVAMMDDTNSYSMNVNGNGAYSTGYNTHISNASTAILSWSLPTAAYVNYMYYTVKFSKKPSNVQVQFNYSSSWYNSELLGSSGNTYFYRQPYGSSVGSVSIKASFDSAYTGFFELVSCFQSSGTGYSINNVTIDNQALLYYPDQDRLFRSAHEYKTNVSLPYTSKYESDHAAYPVDPLLAGCIFLRNGSEDFPFDYADSVTYLIETCGTADKYSDNPNFAASLFDPSGTAYATLPVTVYPVATFAGTGYNFGSSTMQNPIYLYSVVVDTSGFDLHKSSISLDYMIEPVYISVDEDWTGYYTRVRSIVAVPTVIDEPWYARFGRWLTDGFNSVVDSIRSAFNPNNGSELEQAGQDMQNSANDIGAASDSLGSVAQPEVDAGDMIGDLTKFDTGGLRVLSCITSNAQVTAMMVVVFTFCLAGYIFFGKKR